MTEGFGRGGENILSLMLNDINIGIVLICVSSLPVEFYFLKCLL